MQRSITKACLLGAALLCVSTVAVAQAKTDFGKREYDSNCAVCHGVAGDGRGPYWFMKTQASDLTTLAKRNGGVFPIQRVYETIDGRGPEIQAHGPRDMPIWGTDYSAEATARMANEIWLVGTPEAHTRYRILALIDYLYRIQKK